MATVLIVLKDREDKEVFQFPANYNDTEFTVWITRRNKLYVYEPYQRRAKFRYFKEAHPGNVINYIDNAEDAEEK